VEDGTNGRIERQEEQKGRKEGKKGGRREWMGKGRMDGKTHGSKERWTEERQGRGRERKDRVCRVDDTVIHRLLQPLFRMVPKCEAAI
jgi:hypothetical protein